MLPFTLIEQPEYEAALEKLGPARDLELLVVYHGELARREFLGNILKAAGYTEPGNQLHLLEWPVSEPLDLMSLIRTTGVRKVILFGYEPAALGLHFQVANYFSVQIGNLTFLLADSLEFIEETKKQGDNRPAGALWKAVKENFLRAHS